MKKFLSLLLVTLLMVLLLGIPTAFAGSASASISGPSSVEAGKTYTYTYTLNYSSCSNAYIDSVSVGGVFEKVGGGETLWHETFPENTSGSKSGSITVKVSSSAKPGDKGSISVSGEGGYVENNDPHTFDISGSKPATVVDAPDPTATSKPTTRPTRNPNATPKPTEKPTGWELAANNIAEMPDGGTVSLSDLEDTKMPIELLSDLKDKGGTTTVDFGTYTCTIDASAIATIPEGINEIDLGLDMEVDEALSEAVGGQDIYQLHFAHEGQFPCPISFTFKAENSSPGDVVYLYYYYGTANVIEGQMSATVDENGYVTFDIYHCSSYFVSNTVIEGSNNNFDSDSDAQIATLTEELDTAKAALEEAQSENETLKAQLEEAQKEAELNKTQDADVKAASAAAAGALEITMPALIAAGLGIALIAVIATMAICHVGLFKKKKAKSCKGFCR